MTTPGWCQRHIGRLPVGRAKRTTVLPRSSRSPINEARRGFAVRGWIAGGLVAVTAVVAAQPARAEPAGTGERLMMSHRCVVDRGRLLVMSAREEIDYAIVGPRSETPVSFCRAGTDCRHFATHAFAVACEGGVVAWVEIAAALSHQRLGRATIESGRLLLRPYDGPASQDPTKRRVSATLTFPEGHAPLKELGVRLVQPVAAPLAYSPNGTADVTVQLAAPASEPPLPWLTVVERQSTPGAQHWQRLAGLAGAVAAVGMAGALWLARRSAGPKGPVFSNALARRLRRPGTPARSSDEQACFDLLTLADAHVGKLDATIAGLGAAQPLRRALGREVRRHQQRLVALSGSASSPSSDWRRLRGRLEALIAELSRLQDIADGAVRSVDRAPSATPVTAVDRQSAFEVLGLAPDASERVVKKLVDALRASWHPDLARDEIDRRQREARIKEINVAWDLISGKRQEA